MYFFIYLLSTQPKYGIILVIVLNNNCGKIAKLFSQSYSVLTQFNLSVSDLNFILLPIFLIIPEMSWE